MATPCRSREVIKQAANVEGGVHAGTPSTDRERLLSEYNAAIRIGGIAALVRALRAIADVVVQSLSRSPIACAPIEHERYARHRMAARPDRRAARPARLSHACRRFASQSSGLPGHLGVFTGYLDDRRQVIADGTELYPIFVTAWLQQRLWTDAAHQDFWIDNLPRWPHPPGKAPTLDTVATWARVLRRDGMTKEIAACLGFAVDTPRVRLRP